jgi:CelD/BcsL family acetyltransferase involved in cellulose biosynthesis
VQIHLSEDPGDFARSDWAELVAADPDATFFHSPRYLRLYWEEFGRAAPLILAFAEEEARLVGAAAFELDGRLLRFLGGTEVTDYTSPIATAGVEDAVAKELLGAMADRDDWDRAELQGLPEDSPWLRRLADAASARGLAVNEDLDAVAPFLELPPSFEEYLSQLPGKLRHEVRRKARRLENRLGGPTVTFATPESLDDDIALFAEMHRSSEGRKGRFMVPGMERFFGRLGQLFIPEGEFHLAFLESAGERAAAAVAFRHRGTFFLYNSAYDRAYKELAPGMVLVADLIAHAIDDGCSTFDMLKGDLGYKYRFGAARREVRCLAIARS